MITTISRLFSERYRVTTQRQTIYITPYYTLTYILQLTIYPTRRDAFFLSFRRSPPRKSEKLMKPPAGTSLCSPRDLDFPRHATRDTRIPDNANMRTREHANTRTRERAKGSSRERKRTLDFSAANRFLFISPGKLRAEIRRACERGKSRRGVTNKCVRIHI